MRYMIYTDGSYKQDKETGLAFYGSAAIVAKEGTSDWTQLTQCGNDPRFLKHHNVTGEVFAAIQAFDFCINTLKLEQGTQIQLGHDYIGIVNWLRNPGDPDYWRQKTPLSQMWRHYYYTVVKPRFTVQFIHTPGHSGIPGNEIVDGLAREMVSKHLAEALAKR